MTSRKLAVLVAASLVASSSSAFAQAAQPLSLASSSSVARAGADLEDSNQMTTTGYVALGAALLAAIIIFLALDDDENDAPVSP